MDIKTYLKTLNSKIISAMKESAIEEPEFLSGAAGDKPFIIDMITKPSMDENNNPTIIVIDHDAESLHSEKESINKVKIYWYIAKKEAKLTK